MDNLRTFVNLPLRYHLLIATCIRLALICYANYHDRAYDVPYTDVDYKVFTDAARHVYNGQSPYKRHTYRYSPLIAMLMIPNLYWKEFGKVLFSIFDIFITLAIKSLVEHQLSLKKVKTKAISNYCSFFWLYNPMSIAISTRGNADSVPCFCILMSLMFLQTNFMKGFLKAKYALSGILLGFSIHLRLYPLAFSFPMYLSLGNYQVRRSTIKGLFMSLLPNKKQFMLTISCVVTLAFITYCMYNLYEYDFIFETYIYHLFRKDTKHNFSIFFYYAYLTMDDLQFDLMKAIAQFLEFIILFMMSLTFGCDAKTLPFCLFCQTVVLVAYNSVMTSQYFIWFLSLMPVVIHSFKMAPTFSVVLGLIWTAPQAAWLFYAYLLEFKCGDVFIFIWFKSVLFFCANVYVLCQLIKSYTPGYAFGYSIADNKK